MLFRRRRGWIFGRETEKLLEMAQDFKQQVDATNLSSTLPLDLMKRTRRIEKQMKKIERQMKS